MLVALLAAFATPLWAFRPRAPLCCGCDSAVASTAAVHFPAGASSRQIAHTVLLRCAKGGLFADRTLHAELERAQLSAKDAGHATEIVYGVMRWQRSLDFTLSQLARLSRTDMAIRIALRIGAYELLHLRTADHAAVHEAVSLARREVHRRFVNGMLRNVARKRDELRLPEEGSGISAIQALSVRCSLPEWLLADLSATFLDDEALSQWAHSNQERPELTLRVNRMRSSRESVAEKLRASGREPRSVVSLPDGLVVPEGTGEVTALPGFSGGTWSVQDIAAQLVALLAHPVAGQVVVDLCAAPGGKSTHMAELMGDGGLVIAVELHEKKLRLIDSACERLGLHSVSSHALDGSDVGELRRILRSHGYEQADAIVVDAPCSGIGILLDYYLITA